MPKALIVAKIIVGVGEFLVGISLLMQTCVAAFAGQLTHAANYFWIWTLLAALLFLCTGCLYIWMRNRATLKYDTIAVTTLFIATIIGLVAHNALPSLSIWGSVGLIVNVLLLYWHYNHDRNHAEE